MEVIGELTAKRVLTSFAVCNAHGYFAGQA